jgi:hypothetical protein
MIGVASMIGVALDVLAIHPALAKRRFGDEARAFR